jgi:acyl-lipid omega-6 desaturase (Delta-12 desaturase)
LYHHGHVGDRGKPDGSRTILFTTEEYEKMVWYEKVFWRVIREPLIFFSLVPLLQFFLLYRFERLKEPHSYVPTFYLIANFTLIYRIDPTLAFLEFLGIWGGCIFGFLLFHWQHEVNSGYWVDSNSYNPKDASLTGCTHLLVPFWWKWSTLGIEYHHIHHLSTKVPCYNLQECHEQAPQDFWTTVTEVGWGKAFASFFNVMWNLKTQRFETFPIHKTFLKLIGLENQN